MFFPIGDTPNPVKYTPWMTWLIIGVNIVIFIFITLPLSRQGISIDDPMLQEYLRAIAEHIPPGVSLNQVLPRMTPTICSPSCMDTSRGPSAPDLFFSMFLHGGSFTSRATCSFSGSTETMSSTGSGGRGFLFTYCSQAPSPPCAFLSLQALP